MITNTESIEIPEYKQIWDYFSDAEKQQACESHLKHAIKAEREHGVYSKIINKLSKSLAFRPQSLRKLPREFKLKCGICEGMVARNRFFYTNRRCGDVYHWRGKR